ncbi:RNA polymerase sigma factor [Pendulispora rubella]|uniref:RNA polymerase sigma factor n=1 Tax=Pendulispora rubella TaxID=2741070 RepID=A0ABZ2LEU4_9BACT
MKVRGRKDDGTNEELAELYRRYGYLLQRRSRTLLRDPAAAEDALQDAFVKIIHARSELTTVENPVAWMYRVVDRCCFDQLRRRKLRRTEPLDDHENEPHLRPGVDVESRNAALRILHELSEPEFEVAVLAYVDGMNQTEIAATLGVSRPTIWKRLTQIREHAADLLGEVP